MYKQLHKIILEIHGPDACHTECDIIPVQHDGRNTLVAEQLEVRHFIAAQVKRATLDFQMGFPTRCRIYAFTGVDVIRFGKAAPLRVDDDETLQQAIRATGFPR